MTELEKIFLTSGLTVVGGALVFVLHFRMARHPAAIRTGTSTTWLHRWAMYSRMSSGPSWSVERWKYCANYTPMSSEHGCERLSHDQPIVFSRP